jgi:RNA polymerase sigma-70 factor (ECF subfamily)
MEDAMPTTRTTAMPCSERHADDDAALVKRALDGDTGAFESLVCRHSGALYRMARGIVGESDAQDVWQKAMVKIHDKLDTLNNPSSFKSWAYRLVKNEALMAVRREKRNEEIGFGDLNEGRDAEEYHESTAPDWKTRADQALQHAELRGKIADAVDELESKYRVPFVLYELEGVDFDAIGDRLGLTAGGVKTRVHRARLQLRASLERYTRDDLKSIA